MFCWAVLCVPSRYAAILVGMRELDALLCLSSWCLMTVIVLWFLLMVPWIGLQCVIVAFSDQTYLSVMLTRSMKIATAV